MDSNTLKAMSAGIMTDEQITTAFNEYRDLLSAIERMDNPRYAVFESDVRMQFTHLRTIMGFRGLPIDSVV